MASRSQLWTFPNSRVTEEGPDQRATRPWQNWYGQVSTIGSALTQSGTTADRPAERTLASDPPPPPLWVGRTYFDTTLGKPIWIKSTGPLVWVDATGSSGAQSGVTASRPTTEFYVGRQYFDTTLGQPIWWLTSDPDPEVWVDATGTPV